MHPRLSDFTDALGSTPFADGADTAPWALTQSIEDRVRGAPAALGLRDWLVQGEIAVHRSATVEAGSIGADAVLASGARLAAQSLAPRLALVEQELA